MANIKRRWTVDEIEILKKYYPIEGDEVCKRLPGRTAKSCRVQASKMEISKKLSAPAAVQDDGKYIRLWTETEDKILREYYSAEGSNVRYRLNQRSAESCRGRAALLGLAYHGTNRKWSVGEDEILRSYYPTEGTEVQKRLEGRSKEACNKRAAKIGLRSQSRKEWTAEEDEIIRKYYKTEGRKAADRLEGRTVTACQSRAKYLNVRSDNNKASWTPEEDAILTRYYEEKGAGYVQALIPERSLQACKYRAMLLGLSANSNTPWTREEEKIMKEYYPVEGSKVCKRLNNRTRNACIGKAAQLKLQYGPPMYKGPALDEWIILAVKQGITKLKQSMTYSEIYFKPGNLPKLHLKLECDAEGKIKVYEDTVLSDKKVYDRQQIKKILELMQLQIKENRIVQESSEEDVEGDIFRTITGCYMIWFSSAK